MSLNLNLFSILKANRGFAVMHREFYLTLGTIFLCLTLLIPAPLSAQNVHKIAVLVNNDMISERDVDQRVRLLRLTGQSSSRQTAIEELIEERLKVQEAGRLGISVSQDEIDGQLSALASRIGARDVTTLRRALGQRGVSLDTLINRYRADLAWRNVVQQQFRRTVRIREQDVIAAVEESGETTEGATTTEYSLQMVTVVVPANASSQDLRNRQAEAGRLQAAITSCSRVRQVASAFRNVVVNDNITRMESDLPPEMAEKLNGVPVGRAMEPERTPEGFRVLAVCNKKEISGVRAASQPVEREMRNREGELLSRRLIRDLRSDAIIEYR